MAEHEVARTCWYACVMAMCHNFLQPVQCCTSLQLVVAACHTYVLGASPLKLVASGQICGCLWGVAHPLKVSHMGFTPIGASHCPPPHSHAQRCKV